MIGGLLTLLGFQLAGEFVVQLFGLQVPGPVVGMAFFFGYLQWRRPGENAGVMRAGHGLLKHLQLLFVPAGVGVVTYLGLIGDSVVPIVVALVGAWVITLLVTAGTASLLLKLRGGRAA